MEVLNGKIRLKMDHTSKRRVCFTFPTVQETDQSCKRFVYIVFIINFILLTALIVTTYYWKCQDQSLTSSRHLKEQQICLQCEKISVHPLDDESLLKGFERNDNDTKCCTRDASKWKHLVHQFVERNHRLYLAKEGITIPHCPDQTNEEKPAGRVVGVDRNRTGNNYEERHVLRWLSTGYNFHQTSGITFTDGQLEITTPGYYWFNSRVTFRESNTAIFNDRFAFFHAIFRRPAEYPLRDDWKIVEAGKTRCKLQSGFTDRSSFIHDIAYFKKGERVIVKVSHPEMVSLSATDSFLDVHLY